MQGCPPPQGIHVPPITVPHGVGTRHPAQTTPTATPSAHLPRNPASPPSPKRANPPTMRPVANRTAKTAAALFSPGRADRKSGTIRCGKYGPGRQLQPPASRPCGDGQPPEALETTRSSRGRRRRRRLTRRLALDRTCWLHHPRRPKRGAVAMLYAVAVPVLDGMIRPEG